MRLPTPLLLLVAGLLAGCATPGDRDPDRDDPPFRDTYVGEIVKVRPDLGYVVVQCPRLPTAGETATVFREGRRVAVIRFDARPPRPPFHTADIEQGRPRAGDEVTQP